LKSRIKSIFSIINFNILIRLPIIFIVLIFIFYSNELQNITIIQAFKGMAAVIAGWLLYLRFKTTDDMKRNQEEQFHLTNQYGHFLETSKLLTAKDSTIEAKISAMYLLYDYAKNHPQEVEKVYQLLSEYIKPLLNCIDGNCNHLKYTKVQDSVEVESLSQKITFKYKENKVLNFDIKDNNSRERITSWQKSGSQTEKLTSIALIILRDMTMNILPETIKHIELSNIIIFYLKIDSVEIKSKIKFKSILRPTYSLVFLDCNLKGIDFSESKFYYCKFINCDLDDANFDNCDLYKTEFINCDLKNARFHNVCISNVSFQDCINIPGKEFFETSIAIFEKITDDEIQKKYKKNYLHLFQPTIFSKLLSISHLNIIKLHNINEKDKVLTYEYFDSISLREFLKLNNNLNLVTLKKILKDIAIAIDYLHQNNIVHIDINDTNILINKSFEIKLNDFDFIEIMTSPNDNLKQIDIHSYIILVYRIIQLPKQWNAIKTLNLLYKIPIKNEYTSCLDFFNKLELQE